jgi:hypothetical protein
LLDRITHHCHICGTRRRFLPLSPQQRHRQGTHANQRAVEEGILRAEHIGRPTRTILSPHPHTYPQPRAVSLGFLPCSISNERQHLTAPGCGKGDILICDARTKIELIPTVLEPDVDMVLEQPWSHAAMSDAAKLETGML